MQAMFFDGDWKPENSSSAWAAQAPVSERMNAKSVDAMAICHAGCIRDFDTGECGVNHIPFRDQKSSRHSGMRLLAQARNP
jgi:hypothetical protein